MQATESATENYRLVLQAAKFAHKVRVKMCGKSARQSLVTKVGGKPWMLKCHIQACLKAARFCIALAIGRRGRQKQAGSNVCRR